MKILTFAFLITFLPLTKAEEGLRVHDAPVTLERLSEVYNDRIPLSRWEEACKANPLGTEATNIPTIWDDLETKYHTVVFEKAYDWGKIPENHVELWIGNDSFRRTGLIVLHGTTATLTFFEGKLNGVNDWYGHEVKIIDLVAYTKEIVQLDAKKNP